MNCFQLVKTVLDELYDRIPGSSETEKDALIGERLRYLSERYNTLAVGTPDASPIEYSDPATRFAYVYRYVTSHANIVHDLICQSRPIRRLFDPERARITSIGGGPGSDFLGVLKYVLAVHKSVAIKCILYDREEAWGECWMDIDDKLGPSPSMTVFLQQFDITDPNTWVGHSKYLDSDLFTMIYFLSEVYALRDQATPFFENLFSNMRQGALALYVDNNAEAFYGWFDELVEGRGIDVLETESIVMQLAVDEEKTDLGEYYLKFGYPKLTANIAYRICRKR